MKDVKTISLKIEGMTCASCVSRVEKAISKVEGIKSVAINLASETAIISVENEKYNFEKIKKFVEDAGYGVIQLDKKEKFSQPLKSLSKLDLAKNDFLTSLVFTVPVFIINMLMMSDVLLNKLGIHISHLSYLLFLLTSLLILLVGRKFYIKFIKNLLHLSFDMDSLIAIGTGSAFIYSSAVTFFPYAFPIEMQTHIYYDTTAVIITLVLLGRWLETKAKLRTNQAINELIKMQPTKVLVKENNQEIEKDIDELKIGDIVILKPGQHIPTDGVIVNGFSSVDESIVTGESMPVEKKINSNLLSGSVNKTGYLEYKVSSSAANSTLGKIIKLMEQAQSVKAPIQKIADKISAIFVPIVIFIAFISFISWYFISNSFEISLINFISVLIIACPCALGLAIPTALIVGIGSAAKNGILIRDGSSLELFDKVTSIFFDKTGTLTENKLKVVNYKLFNLKLVNVLEYIIPAEKKSEHPIALALIEFANNYSFLERKLEKFESKTGLGIKSQVDGKEILIGNKNFLFENGFKNINLNDSDYYSKVFVIIDNNLEAIFDITEIIKPEVRNVIKKFTELGVKTFILSGDKITPTARIAKNSGVTDFQSELLPEDKLNIIKKFQSQGEICAFIGDGINDAPTITQADVGIAMGSGTDIAILSGSVILINNNLDKLITFRNISKKVNSAIKQNLFWAFIYNIIGIPLAAFGLLNPIFAAFAMSMSSISVITNSLRIKKSL